MLDNLQINSLHALSQKKKEAQEPKEPKEPKEPRKAPQPKPQNISLEGVPDPAPAKNVGRPKGSKNKPKVKRAFRTMVLKTDASSNDERVYYCSCCGKGYKTQKTNYYMSSSVLYKENNGYIQVCKVCANKYFSQLKEFFLGNIPKAIERCCQLFDWYYSPKCIEAMLKSTVPVNSELSAYLSKINMYQVKEQGTDYLQTLVDNDEKECRINSYEDLENHIQQNSDDDDAQEETIERYKVTRDDIRRWGEGYTPEEYEFLDTQHKEWSVTLEEHSDRIVYDPKVMEELVKNICVSLLTIRRYQKTNSDKLGTAMKTFQDLLSTCNLQPELITDTGSSSLVSYGQMIKMIEDEEPIGDPSPEWQDADGIRKYINTWYLGGLAKAVHINNPNAAMYEEAVREYEKYTIDNKAKEFVGDTSIFDNLAQDKEVEQQDNEGTTDLAERVENEQSKTI